MLTVKLQSEDDFDGWREGAKRGLLANVPPSAIQFQTRDMQSTFFDDQDVLSAAPLSFPVKKNVPTVPKAFIDVARTVICHSDQTRFLLLYNILVRLQDDKNLLRRTADKDVHRAYAFAKEVRRDIHKMKAFVRFRKVDNAADGIESFVAWFEPSHHIVRLAAPFFSRRFSNMRWSILTPAACVHWDCTELEFTPGVSKSEAPDGDALEDYWRTYYGSIFNPARLKIDAMTSEMPKKYWKNLPEAALIPDLIRKSRSLEQTMMDAKATIPRAAMMKHRQQSKTLVDLANEDIVSVEKLSDAVRGCRACPLWETATQAVPGSGPSTARIMLVGEQPGDNEDLTGEPFVGPAGQLLRGLLAKIDMPEPYITNAVKHFKYEVRGKRRLHKNPSTSEIQHCRWWLDKEIELIKPKVIVALGASAMMALTGVKSSVESVRGSIQLLPNGLQFIPTYHPSFALRVRDKGEKLAILNIIETDLKLAKNVVDENYE